MSFNTDVLVGTIEPSYVIKEYGSTQVKLSRNPLAEKAVIITTEDPKPYSDWTVPESFGAFLAFKEIANVWQAIGLEDEYLVYGRQRLGSEDTSFHWEAVPYYKTTNWFSEVWQQLVVLCKIAFGALGISEETLNAWYEEYTTAFAQYKSQNQDEAIQVEPEIEAERKDPFCNPVQIEKQCVLEDVNVRVLYNYAPLGLGEEKLHFLFMPKRHEADFNQFTDDEYLEIADLSKKLIVHFSENRHIEDVHLFRKFGKGAGQTVFHGHLHMVLTATKTETYWGYFKVAMNILFNSRPLPEDILRDSVEGFKRELKPIQDTYPSDLSVNI